jgi:hypothetical protein
MKSYPRRKPRTKRPFIACHNECLEVFFPTEKFRTSESQRKQIGSTLDMIDAEPRKEACHFTSHFKSGNLVSLPFKLSKHEYY